MLSNTRLWISVAFVSVSPTEERSIRMISPTEIGTAPMVSEKRKRIISNRNKPERMITFCFWAWYGRASCITFSLPDV
jgi:hypothetical protein